MNVEALHDRDEIERHLRRDPDLNLYALGDLDDSFFGRTSWLGGRSTGRLEALVLLFLGERLPTLVALAHPDELRPLRDLLEGALPYLPGRFYAHLSGGLESVLASCFDVVPHGAHLRMALRTRSAFLQVDARAAHRLGPGDREALLALYDASYPGNWFDPWMLSTGEYFGVRRDGDLVSVAGVHCFSRSYGVAALGNITTHPLHRGRGLGRVTTAALLGSVTPVAEHVGLNVSADNGPAISLYRSLGFEPVASYYEALVRARP